LVIGKHDQLEPIPISWPYVELTSRWSGHGPHANKELTIVKKKKKKKQKRT